ncbi:PAP2 superfamily protein [Streptococcus pseudoporcinus]|uniref:PAP2 superfamily protein n=1 Tax=Streptococcus pseudoporcinus TaxID=361101 RepID=A0A4U9XZE9_9STRE|nr:phosphatase PAP2 family protein [Streptococcus pseudoporcinus]VTS18969.1 PAP2 superfamily protein [Streptococcus pseudoporcinus]VTS37052.1 PAP2 superfamily protein [Streptococcus pseudoporcinus]VUC68764.1 PAP2 superfamily protein [Streptococcus pseudoporcinus]VUC99442.1 PAP2 superfamily protein [Streptococcus pseudoporcinus]VUC99834.1 PAP2 superfamily protein [Streptococcus pseudoporcinus]
MKTKQTYLLRSSFAFLIFVMLGYTVQFYPYSLVVFDDRVQNAIRGSLPDQLTSVFRAITYMGNVSTQVLVVALLTILFLIKKWKTEALFQLTNGLLAGLLVTGFKFVYQRARPSLEHIVYAGGYSFPSGHAMGAMMIYGALMVILLGRFQKKSTKILVILTFSTLILLIGLSRIYLGVHYPTDVIGGFVLGYGILNLLYPYYKEKRFEWRFQSKQK